MRALLAALLLAPQVLAAQTATTITFDPPTDRVDGTPLDPATEIAEYALYCHAQGTEGPPGEDVLTIPGLTDTGVYETTYDSFLPEKGRYDCAMTAIDTDGRESSQSDVVEVSWLDAPGTPTNVIILVE